MPLGSGMGGGGEDVRFVCIYRYIINSGVSIYIYIHSRHI